MTDTRPIQQGQIVTGSAFNEPMRVVTVSPIAPGSWMVGMVGIRSSQFRSVALGVDDLARLKIIEGLPSYDSDPTLLKLGLQAYSLGIAWEFDPYFGLSISRVDPLPHQLEAVYDYLLKLARVRFLLADDAGAGKTIMAGLLIRELKLRGLVERMLIVCPANLTFQWQRELKEKFDETFQVLKGGIIREQYGVNQFIEQKQVITSLDLAKRTEILPGLKQVHWDLVIVDEAHRMSWSPPSKKTARYALGELLRDTSDHILLLTATPHKGDPVNFSLFLQLLDQDAFADTKSIHAAMDERRAPFYLRRTKEAMVYFPSREDDGNWVTKKIFTRRIPMSVDFAIDGLEFELYKDVTRFVKHNSAMAASQEGARARAVGFLMFLYQRRLASSTYSLRHSLENKIRRHEENLKHAEDLMREPPEDIPTPEELEEMEDSEKERWERIFERMTLARNPDEVKAEIIQLRKLAEQARAVEDSGTEAKLSRLKNLLKDQGFFDQPDKRLLIFTEFKDTLDYLVKNLKELGFKVGFIHGGMRPGNRDEPGSRIHTEAQFWDGTIQILAATEAAGEGINLHCCNMMFNYDIPWNPNRLEQRMGRIHRYGQRKDCLIFNFVATNTVEGHVLKRLMEKLQEIRRALDDDAVFNVVGEVLPAAHIDRVLRAYYAGELGEADLEDRLLRDVDEDHFRRICQNALEGLATKNLNLEMLVERKARAQERRVVPETIARFMRESSGLVPLNLKPMASMPHTFDKIKTPHVLQKYEAQKGWRFGMLASQYPRFSTDRDTAGKHSLEWVTPGHPLFEAIRLHTLEDAQEAFKKGACYYSLQHEKPARIDFFRARVVDGLGNVVHERLFAVELTEGAEPKLVEPSVLGNFNPAQAPEAVPAVASAPIPTEWLITTACNPFLEEVRSERLAEIDRISRHIELSLTELLQKEDEKIGAASDEVKQNIQGAEGRLAQAESRHQDLWNRREKRRRELDGQRALLIHDVDRIATALVLPHPEREAPEVKNLRPNSETEATAMRVVMEHEASLGRQVYDVHERNLGYDITSLDLNSGELRLIEVKGIGASTGTVVLTPNERRVAEDRPDCFWLYLVTDCSTEPKLQEPIGNPAKLPWVEVSKVQHYTLTVNEIVR